MGEGLIKLLRQPPSDWLIDDFFCENGKIKGAHEDEKSN
jgi:hypothetical protein